MDTDKYGKSINGRQCYGPCYYPMTRIYHPLYLQEVTQRQDPVCPTTKFIDPNTKQVDMFDKCSKPTKKKRENWSLLTITPEIKYDEKTFLNIYYNIFSQVLVKIIHFPEHMSLDNFKYSMINRYILSIMCKSNIKNPFFGFLRNVSTSHIIYGLFCAQYMVR